MRPQGACGCPGVRCATPPPTFQNTSPPLSNGAVTKVTPAIKQNGLIAGVLWVRLCTPLLVLPLLSQIL